MTRHSLPPGHPKENIGYKLRIMKARKIQNQNHESQE